MKEGEKNVYSWPSLCIGSEFMNSTNSGLKIFYKKFLNIGITLFDINHRNIFFLDMSLKAKGTKAKINKWGLIKPEIFYTVKETTKKGNLQNRIKYLQMI